MLTYDYWTNIRYKDNIKQLEFYKNTWHTPSATILLNFAEPNKFGCDWHCPFCVGNKLNFDEFWYPSDEVLTEFINKYAKSLSTIRICGGGDPLYNFERNKEKIKHLLAVIKAANKYCQMTTKAISTVDQFYMSDWLADISSYSLSIEELSEKTKNTIKKLLDSGKYVRITKLINPLGPVSDADIKHLCSFLDFYNLGSTTKHNFSVCFRTNSNYPIDEDKLNDLKQYFDNYLKTSNLNTHLKLNKHVSNYLGLQLINSEVIHCCDVEDYLYYCIR